MPVIRYLLQVDGEADTFKETEIFPFTTDPTTLVNERIVKPLQASRAKLGEPGIQLVRIQVLNPHLHSHDWHRTSLDRFALKVHYVCNRCCITAYRRWHMIDGESLSFVRDESYASDRKYLMCKDPLKSLPKTIAF